jgi:VanZ family protein
MPAIAMPRSPLLVGKTVCSGDSRMRFFIKTAARIAAWLLSIAIIALSLVPPRLRPETDVPHNLEHFSIFFATGMAFGVGYTHRSGLVTVALVIFASAIEFAQIVTPGRHARLSDFIVDALAACVGVMIAFFAATRMLENCTSLSLAE